MKFEKGNTEMKKFICAMALSLVALNVSANVEGPTQPPIQHESSHYLMAQYQIIKNIFPHYAVDLLEDRDIRITLPVSVALKNGGKEITRPVRDDLKVFADFMNKYPESVLKIHGHADSVGSEKRNLVVSQGRAQIILEQLAHDGISLYRLTAIGEGEEVPKCSNMTKDGRECNRRIELVLSLEPFLYH
jgi:outer membrane protein OmpA-like peptidoglycan-associated protein